MAEASVLPDVLVPGLAVVFVGEAAGEESARLGQYYAGKGNTFWNDLYQAVITPRLLAPHEFRELPMYGVGLTDCIKQLSNRPLKTLPCEERSREMRLGANELRRKIERFQPQAICCLGLKVGREIGHSLFGRQWAVKRREPGRQCDTHIGITQVWLCPSTSGLARGQDSVRKGVLDDLYRLVVKPWQGSAK
jgi:TDG/mug DNA glycosylase family protein